VDFGSRAIGGDGVRVLAHANASGHGIRGRAAAWCAGRHRGDGQNPDQGSRPRL